MLAFLISILTGIGTGFGPKWYREWAEERQIRKKNEMARQKALLELQLAKIEARAETERNWEQDEKKLEGQRAAYRALPPDYEINRKLEYDRLLKLAEDRARDQIEQYNSAKK